MWAKIGRVTGANTQKVHNEKIDDILRDKTKSILDIKQEDGKIT